MALGLSSSEWLFNTLDNLILVSIGDTMIQFLVVQCQFIAADETDRQSVALRLNAMVHNDNLCSCRVIREAGGGCHI